MSTTLPPPKVPVLPVPIGTLGGKKLRSAADLDALGKRLMTLRDPKKPTIIVCGGTGCRAYRCGEVIDALRAELAAKKLEARFEVRVTGCHGFCERGPLMILMPEGTFYQRVSLADVPKIVEKTLLGNEVLEHLLYKDPQSGQKVVRESDIPFYAKQMQLIFHNNRFIDPTRIEDYLAVGGYQALSKVLTTMKPADMLALVKKSGLRGRGGGGFPAGVKWETAAEAEGDERFVVCNGDEGDPGAYMDRSLMEGNPHSVLEGMIIGSYAIGSHQGFLYVRDEYPLAVLHLSIAIEQAREYGLLGRNILGTGHTFNVRIVRGGGAFVCGESTALMASIEGRPGEPRAKYVHTVEKGLWNKPSCLNNVETWANVPLIVNQGLEAYTAIGTGDVTQNPWGGSKGTKVFSLVGKINNTGLVEVPMGVQLREIIFDIGGGVPKGRKFKAVQTGGPSGGCIPEMLLDMPVDFDELTRVGSMMGSGGMIVMDDRTCMVDVARYFIKFLQEESCGKCTPCREGLRQMGTILARICEGKGKEGDVELLEELAQTVYNTSLCGLGQSAPNPVQTTLKYFRDEYEAHIREHRCPAGQCKELISFRIDPAKCTGCQVCLKNCPQNCITGEKKKVHVIDMAQCVKCGSCEEVCKLDAVVVE
jgi:NADH:ubiquinone oxidoreductase subunit F (NADH-binding)/(2Fe-2S) ferredoxin/NAD-dependent dihydropyrimidine dehydrogenase PreA subunit